MGTNGRIESWILGVGFWSLDKYISELGQTQFPIFFKYFLRFGKIYLIIKPNTISNWTNTSCTREIQPPLTPTTSPALCIYFKYTFLFGQIYFRILDKYNIQFKWINLANSKSHHQMLTEPLSLGLAVAWVLVPRADICPLQHCSCLTAIASRIVPVLQLCSGLQTLLQKGDKNICFTLPYNFPLSFDPAGLRWDVFL